MTAAAIEPHHLQAIYAALSTKLYAVILTAGVPRQDADDVLQEIACGAFDAVQRFQGGDTGKLTRWLNSICRNQIRRYWRRRKRQAPEVSLDDLNVDDALWSMLATDDAQDALRDAELRAEMKARWAHMDTTGMPQACLECFSSHLYRRRTLAQLAGECRVSVSTVHRCHERTIAALRAVPVEALRAADLDQCRIRALIGDVTVYRAPSPKTGAGLARMSARQRDQNLFRVK